MQTPPTECQGVVVIADHTANPSTVNRILPSAETLAERARDALQRDPMYCISVHRSVWLRLLTGLWALWFGVVLVEPAALSCPEHGAHGHQMQQQAGGGDRSHHGGQSHHAKTTCTCLGACCCAPTVAAPLAAFAELPAARVNVAGDVAPVGPDEPNPSAPSYSHPFANGPPASTSA